MSKFKITDFDGINVEIEEAIIKTDFGVITILPNHAEIVVSGYLEKTQEKSLEFLYQQKRIFFFQNNFLFLL